MAARRKTAADQLGLQVRDPEPAEPEPLSYEERKRLALAAPVRVSTLRRIDPDRGSAAHYLDAVIEEHFPSPEREKATSALIQRGLVAHDLAANRPIAVWESRRAGKDWEAFQAAHKEERIASATDMRLGRGMMAAIDADPHARALMFGPRCRHEERIFWEHLGVPMSSTPDVVTTVDEVSRDGEVIEAQAIVDLKTTGGSCHPDAFGRACLQRYAVQLAAYRLARRCELRYLEDDGKPYPPIHCYIVGVEQQPPHGVTVFRFTERALQFGERQLSLWMERYRQCLAADAWPGYSQTILDLDAEDEAPGLIFDDDDATDTEEDAA